MDNVDGSSKTLDITNAFFDDNFLNVDLNEDLQKIYNLIGPKDLLEKHEENIQTFKIRNENHKRYHNINIYDIKKLPDIYKAITSEIINLYYSVSGAEILNADLNNSENISKLLDSIYNRIDSLEKLILKDIKDLTIKNDNIQNTLNIDYINSLRLSKNITNKLRESYNDLILYSSFFEHNIYKEIRRQVERKNKISEIISIIHNEEVKKTNATRIEKIKVLNENINLISNKYKDKIQYLEDLMPNNSKYINEFNNFRNFYYSLFAYNDQNYNETKKIYETLLDDSKFKIYISDFEQLFIDEILYNSKKEKFTFEHVGIINLKKSLDYISNNYIAYLDEESKKIIEYIYKHLDDKYNIDELNQALNIIVKEIWKKSITDVNNFNPNDNYCFICSNNQFIDEKYQTILITKKGIELVDDYGDYQIGFICSYNDNIMYITENDDIMTVDGNDMSNLKTPLQVEQEFLNFKVCNRIALNGFKTKIQAVYIINDGNIDKYIKAVELANLYKLPLIELKK